MSSSRATTRKPLSVFGSDASTSQPSWTSWPVTVRECRSRLVSDQGWPHASPRRRPRKAIRCHMAYSRSAATKSRKAPVCSGVQTITGEGFSPVCCHRATRSSVHTRAFGLRTGSISTWAAGLNVMICWPIASFRAARSVALTCWRVEGPVTRRKGGIASIAAFMALRRARFSKPFHGTAANSSMAARRWAFCSRISALASVMAVNISLRWLTRSRSRRRSPMWGLRWTRTSVS